MPHTIFNVTAYDLFLSVILSLLENINAIWHISFHYRYCSYCIIIKLILYIEQGVYYGRKILREINEKNLDAIFVFYVQIHFNCLFN